MKKRISALLLAAVMPLHANISSDLQSFYNGLGIASNVTSPGSFNSQAAGSYGGGSIFARNQVRSYQLIQLDLPSFRAGCGGIDLYMGSMSFLSKDKMIALSKSIMTNAGFYAFDLALATTVPEIKEVKDKIQDIEQFVNNQNINTCEAGEALTSSLWFKSDKASEKICRDQGTMGSQGLFNDYIEARHGCTDDRREVALDAAEKNPELAKRLPYDKNIVWSLLKSKSAIANNDELCELVMSLTGTIIFDKKGHATPVPSLASSRDLIKALIGEGDLDKIKLWQCSDGKSADKCLSVKLHDVQIKKESTLGYQVSQLIDKTYQLMRAEQPNQSDLRVVQSFNAMTHLPIVKYISVLASSEYGDSLVNLSEYSSVIAEDLLQQYLSELLQEVSNVTISSEFDESLINDIKERIKAAREALSTVNRGLNNKLEQKMMLVNSVRMIEREVATQMSNDLA